MELRMETAEPVTRAARWGIAFVCPGVLASLTASAATLGKDSTILGTALPGRRIDADDPAMNKPRMLRPSIRRRGQHFRILRKNAVRTATSSRKQTTPCAGNETVRRASGFGSRPAPPAPGSDLKRGITSPRLTSAAASRRRRGRRGPAASTRWRAQARGRRCRFRRSVIFHNPRAR
jgi:hypothetical protein